MLDTICPRCGLPLSINEATYCTFCKKNTSSIIKQPGIKKHLQIVPGGSIRISQVVDDEYGKIYRLTFEFWKDQEKKTLLVSPIAFFDKYEDAEKAVNEYIAYPYYPLEDITVGDLFILWNNNYNKRLHYHIEAGKDDPNYDLMAFIYLQRNTYLDNESAQTVNERMWETFSKQISGLHPEELTVAIITDWLNSLDLSINHKGRMQRLLRNMLEFYWEFKPIASLDVANYIGKRYNVAQNYRKEHSSEIVLQLLNDKGGDNVQSCLLVNSLRNSEEDMKMINYINRLQDFSYKSCTDYANKLAFYEA